MTSKKNNRNLLIGILIFLLLVNAFLLWNKINQDKKISAQAKENDELVISKAEIEKNYYEAMSELESLRTGNDSLNILIDQQQDELTNQRHSLLSMGKSNKELKSAISSMRSQNDGFIERINKLMEENTSLNVALAESEEQKGIIESKLVAEKERGEQLSGEVETLSEAKEKLEENEQKLVKKVNAASVILVDKVSVSGVKVRKSGKEVGKTKVGSIDKLEICFNATKNYATDVGKEVFHIRIVDPLGQTIAVESMGSGTMTDMTTGKQMRFTRSMSIDYDRSYKEYCAEWTPSNGISPGRYEAYVYNKGYLAGKGSAVFK